MVVLITLDGATPGAIREGSTPQLDEIMRDGSWMLDASGVTPRFTLPCHNSIFRSVPPSIHGVMTDEDSGTRSPFPSLFDVAHASGKRIGMFYNSGPLRDVCLPSSLDVAYFNANVEDPAGSVHLADMALASAHQDRFDLMFLYFGHAEWSARQHGWMSDEYFQALQDSDRALGHFTKAFLSMHEPVNFLIFSGHSDSEEHTQVPLMFWGYRFRSGHQLSGSYSLLDIGPTAAYLLGLKPPEQWRGSPVHEALRDTVEQDEQGGPSKVFPLEYDEE